MIISLVERMRRVLAPQSVKISDPRIVLEFEKHNDGTGSWKIELIESGERIAGHNSFNNPISAKRHIGDLQRVSFEKFGKEAKFEQKNEETDLEGRPIKYV